MVTPEEEARRQRKKLITREGPTRSYGPKGGKQTKFSDLRVAHRHTFLATELDGFTRQWSVITPIGVVIPHSPSR